MADTRTIPMATRNVKRGTVRPLLWVVLVISSVLNIVTSITVANVLVGIGFGLVAMACIAGLVTHHYRNRR
jgi:hypothetical protein